jgi:tRNA (guanine-N7-)-methyltransferase
MKDNEPRFFGRRHSKYLRDSRKKLLDDFLPKIAVNLPFGEEKINLQKLFSINFKAVWLEIGFGGGEHLSEQSLRHKDIGFIASEAFEMGVASALAHITGTHKDGCLIDNNQEISSDRVDNVRIFADDVRKLFPFLNNACLEKVFLLFPDP